MDYCRLLLTLSTVYAGHCQYHGRFKTILRLWVSICVINYWPSSSGFARAVLGCRSLVLVQIVFF